MLAPSLTRADTSLVTENWFSNLGQISIDTGVSYSTATRSATTVSQSVSIPTGPSSFVTLPSTLSESQTNVDALVGTLGLSYGLTDAIELSANTNLARSDQRSTSSEASDRQAVRSSGDLWLGMAYRFRDGSKGPALLGFAGIAAQEKVDGHVFAGKSASLGLTTYYTLDPVVMALSVSSGVHRTLLIDQTSYKPGHFFTVSPSISLSVNDRVSMSTGVSWSSRQPDQRNGQRVGLRQTGMDLNFGVGFGLSAETTMSVNAQSNTSGMGGGFSFNVTHTLGASPQRKDSAKPTNS